MRDHVVTLRTAAVAPAAAAQPTICLELFAVAPRGRWRLRLWDADGRNPTPVCLPNGDDFANQCGPLVVPLAGKNFDGKTLTWAVRLQGNGPYHVRMTLLQDWKPASGGDFVYTGPLDGTEEITGRFHFNVANS